MIIDYKTESLDELMNTQFILLEFYAQWCRPCSNFESVLQKVSPMFPKLKVIKIDVDEHPALAEQYGVASIPNMIFIKDNKVWDQVVGVLSESVLSTKIRSLMAC